MDKYIEKIKTELKKPLPGLEHQAKMASLARLQNYDPNPSGARNGAVLLLLFYLNNNLQILFIKRADDGGVHSGQMGFPGGKYEPEDKSLIDTALRETDEEIGVNVSKQEIIGQLSSLFIPVSNYLVHPVIGFIDYTPDFALNKDEVSDVVVAPLGHFLNKKNIHTGEIELKPDIKQSGISDTNQVSRQINTMFYEINGHKIWGATAMIMSEFTEVLRDLA